MVYIAYFTELILQICDYAQKWHIWRENCKYALDENFNCQFCSRPNAAKFCHPDNNQKINSTIVFKIFQNIQLIPNCIGTVIINTGSFQLRCLPLMCISFLTNKESMSPPIHLSLRYKGICKSLISWIFFTTRAQAFPPCHKIKLTNLKQVTIWQTRTPWIVKCNNPFNLVWSTWGWQSWGILKHFPEIKCILISHWSREK